MVLKYLPTNLRIQYEFTNISKTCKVGICKFVKRFVDSQENKDCWRARYNFFGSVYFCRTRLLL